MTEQTTSDYGSRAEPPPSGAAVGFTVFAGVLMLMVGGFQAFAGLVGILENEFYAATPNYLLELDATTWGWVHLLVGLLVAFAGLAVLSGRTWGRVIGVILAVLSALANFAFIPLYPLWSITVIALNVAVIWALTAHGRDITRWE
ncbi:MAG TPA: hypothetical protein VFH23_17250 [Jiangellaceae bacterium]|nr:hypothetical protein [Jiangellaceae bacterium]